MDISNQTVSDAVKNAANSHTSANAAKKISSAVNCTSPTDLFTVATAITVLFANELNRKQLETMINLIALILAGISAIVTQQQICSGEDIQPPI